MKRWNPSPFYSRRSRVRCRRRILPPAPAPCAALVPAITLPRGATCGQDAPAKCPRRTSTCGRGPSRGRGGPRRSGRPPHCLPLSKPRSRSRRRRRSSTGSSRSPQRSVIGSNGCRSLIERPRPLPPLVPSSRRAPLGRSLLMLAD